MNVWFWEKLDILGSELPTSREGHSFQYNPNNKEFLLFGGVSCGRTSEALVLDPSKGTWKNLNKSKPPLERAYHVSWIEESTNRLFIFGGQGTKREPMYDMHSLCLKTGKWVKLGPLEKPSGRIHSAGCIVKNNLFLFGGSSHPSNMLTQDLWCYPFTEIDWKLAEKENHLPSWSLFNTQNTPECRKGHTMLTSSDTIYIFAGYNGKSCMNDVCCISPPDNSFVYPYIFGQCPGERAYHSATMTENSKMIIFGGKNTKNELLCDVHILDLVDLYWSSPFIGGFFPSPRYSAGLAFGRDKKNNEKILVIGGIGNGYAGMDVFNLTEKVIEWNSDWHLEDLQSGKSKLKTSAQSTLLTNKKKIRDLEGQIYLLQEKSGYLDDEIYMLKGKLEEQLSEKMEMKSIYKNVKRSLLKSMKDNQKSSEKISKISYLKKKKISSLEIRANFLCSMLKETESFLVFLDSLFYETISKNLQDEFKNFSQEKMEEIKERKGSHQDGLEDLREFLISNFQQEKDLIL